MEQLWGSMSYGNCTLFLLFTYVNDYLNMISGGGVWSYVFTMSICVQCQWLSESWQVRVWSHTAWPADGMTFYWNVVVPNQLLDKVTCWSMIVPYGTPPGALNFPKAPGAKLGVDSLLQRHRTRAQYLCDTIRGFLVEIDAICQQLPSLTIFGTHSWQNSKKPKHVFISVQF